MERMALYSDPKGPIEQFEWGRFQINGQFHSMDGEGAGKDICMINGRVRSWTTRKGHVLTQHMIDGVMNTGVDILVVGNGVYGKVRVPKPTRKAIKQGGINRLIIEKTP